MQQAAGVRSPLETPHHGLTAFAHPFIFAAHPCTFVMDIPPAFRPLPWPEKKRNGS
jgi:hypothetical protein